MDFVELPDYFLCEPVRKSLREMENSAIIEKVVCSIGGNYERAQIRTLKWVFLLTISACVEITRRTADSPGSDDRCPGTCASICLYETGMASFCVNG
jgi:hypothetical protein